MDPRRRSPPPSLPSGSRRRRPRGRPRRSHRQPSVFKRDSSPNSSQPYSEYGIESSGQHPDCSPANPNIHVVYKTHRWSRPHQSPLPSPERYYGPEESPRSYGDKPEAQERSPDPDGSFAPEHERYYGSVYDSPAYQFDDTDYRGIGSHLSYDETSRRENRRAGSISSMSSNVSKASQRSWPPGRGGGHRYPFDELTKELAHDIAQERKFFKGSIFEKARDRVTSHWSKEASRRRNIQQNLVGVLEEFKEEISLRTDSSHNAGTQNPSTTTRIDHAGAHHDEDTDQPEYLRLRGKLPIG